MLFTYTRSSDGENRIKKKKKGGRRVDLEIEERVKLREGRGGGKKVGGKNEGRYYYPIYLFAAAFGSNKFIIIIIIIIIIISLYIIIQYNY